MTKTCTILPSTIAAVDWLVRALAEENDPSSSKMMALHQPLSTEFERLKVKLLLYISEQFDAGVDQVVLATDTFPYPPLRDCAIQADMPEVKWPERVTITISRRRAVVQRCNQRAAVIIWPAA